MAKILGNFHLALLIGLLLLIAAMVGFHQGGMDKSYWVEVLRFLLNIGHRYGRIFPTLATIARACSCSVRTVCNALAWLAAWGFLSWQRRLKRVQTGLGVMVRQTSNAYRLALSGLASIGARMFSRNPDGNNIKPSRSKVTPDAPFHLATPLFAQG